MDSFPDDTASTITRLHIACRAHLGNSHSCRSPFMACRFLRTRMSWTAGSCIKTTLDPACTHRHNVRGLQSCWKTITSRWSIALETNARTRTKRVKKPQMSPGLKGSATTHTPCVLQHRLIQSEGVALHQTKSHCRGVASRGLDREAAATAGGVQVQLVVGNKH